MTHPLDRVRLDRCAESKTDAELFSARGGTAAFQLVVNSDVPCTVSDIYVTDFISENYTIPAHNCRLYREHYIPVTENSMQRGVVKPEPKGYIPDALIPLAHPVTGEKVIGGRYVPLPFTVDFQRCQPIWVEIPVEHEYPAGTYESTYYVKSQSEIVTGKIQLTIWDFDLPQMQTQKVAFGLDRGTLFNREELARHRMFSGGVDKQQEGYLHERYGLNCAALPFWSGADIREKSMKPAPKTEDILSAKLQHDSRLDTYIYSSDEIGGHADLDESIREWARAIHAANVKHLITMPPRQELMDDGTGRPAVDIWVMLPFQIMDNADAIKTARDAGCEIWSYTCCCQDDYSPKWLFDYSLLEHRILPGFMNYSMDIDGYLYWRVDWFTKNPWEDPYATVDGLLLQGDGCLMYPGEDCGLEGMLLPSMRMKVIRDGLEDYEYCKVYESLVGKEQAKTISHLVSTSFSQWSRDENKLISARQQLGDIIHNYIKERE